jgi:RNA polymerase sigma-70 factor (ECF subfamily)
MRLRSVARRAAPGAGPQEQALTSLYAAYAPNVRAFVRTYTSDGHHAEDVVQETFLRAYQQLHRIDLQRNPRSYLFTIARNVLTDDWRRKNRRLAAVLDDEALAQVPSNDDVDSALEAMVVHEALARLTPAHREVVQALYYDGLTVAEAAERLAVAAGTVKSRSYYAVRALRVVFDEMGVLR